MSTRHPGYSSSFKTCPSARKVRTTLSRGSFSFINSQNRNLSTTVTTNECRRVRMFTSGVTQGCVIDCLILIPVHPLLRPARCVFTQIYLLYWPRLLRILLSFSLPSDSQEYQVCKTESIRHADSQFNTCKKPLPSQSHLAIKAKSFHW